MAKFKSLQRVQDDWDIRDKYMAFIKSGRLMNTDFTQKEIDAIERIDFIDEFMRQHPTMNPNDFANELVQRFCISKQQAYIDIQNAMFIYGDMMRPVKSYERRLMCERLNAIYTKFHDNAKTASTALYALELMIKLMKLDEPDEEEDPRHQRPTEINFGFYPEQLGVKLPENIEQLLKDLQARTLAHKSTIKLG
jgi:hypothetical protein